MYASDHFSNNVLMLVEFEFEFKKHFKVSSQTETSIRHMIQYNTVILEQYQVREIISLVGWRVNLWLQLVL